MAVKHIYLVRHGETSGNHAWVHQSFDVSLDELGRSQAGAAARALAALPVDTILASDAKRAQETAAIIAHVTHVAPRTLALVHELRRAKWVEGRHIFSLASLMSSLLLFIHFGNRAWHHGGGESALEFRDRTREALELLAKEPGEHIAVVSHREFINGMLFDIAHGPAGLSALFMPVVELSLLPNGSITELTYDPSRTTPWRIERRGDTRHLRGL